MLRVASFSHGESRLRLLRLARHGDRHDPKELSVSLRLDGRLDTGSGDTCGDALVPADAIRNIVHDIARRDGSGEVEPLGLAICQALLTTYSQVSRLRAEIVEQPWARVHASGRLQGQVFAAAGPERQTTAITSNGSQVAVVSGIADLGLMRSATVSSAFLVGALSARWTYSSADVTFGPFRRGVRAAILDTFAVQSSCSIPQLLYAIGQVVLASYEHIADMTICMDEHPYTPVRPRTRETDEIVDVFMASGEPLGRVEVTVERPASAR